MSVALENDFSGLVTERVCHDLINPIGAMEFGLKNFCKQGQKIDDELYDLFSKGAVNASIRLQIFRIAFGQSNFGQHLGCDGLMRLIHAYAGQFDIQVECDFIENFTQQHTKILLLGLLVAQSCISNEGHYRVKAIKNGYDVEILHDEMNFPVEIYNLFQNLDMVELTARNVHFFLLHNYLKRSSFMVKNIIEKERIILQWRYSKSKR